VLSSLNGTLYISVAPQVYGYDGNPQRARNGSIIKSTDHGVTWINHLGETNTAPPRTSSGAMFPSTKFANLVFIEHGKDGVLRAQVPIKQISTCTQPRSMSGTTAIITRLDAFYVRTTSSTKISGSSTKVPSS
jgi:hypothetical protein